MPEAVLKLRVRRLFGIILAWVRSFFGGLYTSVDITPRKKIEPRPKEPENRQNLSLRAASSIRIDILSLFPEYFSGPFDASIIGRARKNALVEIGLIDIRDFSENRHKKVDDRPFGGGPGMVMAPQPVAGAIRSVKREGSHVIYLSPQGKTLNAAKCRELSLREHLILLCGHYEGVDERVIEKEVDEEISIGDYVLTSGCSAAIVLVDALLRFVPGVIGHPEAVENDSFEETGIFDAPHYTRPEVFEGMEVPLILRQGHHEEIKKWRKSQAMKKTVRVRPELVKGEVL